MRLPLVGAATGAAPVTGARGARVRVERRVITVASRDGSAEGFAKALVEAIEASGRTAILLGREAGRGGRDPGAALDAAVADPSAVVVVSERVLAIETRGMLDVWIGPRPLAAADAHELAAYASCTLELRASALPVAKLVASELAALGL